MIQKKTISIENLSFETMNGKKILDGVSLRIERDEIVALVGGSGSGKSTIFYCLFRKYFPKRKGALTGQIESNLKMQPVFQDAYSGFNPEWTMMDCLLEPLVIKKMKRKAGVERIQELLPRISMDILDLNKKPGSFSGGQLQRLSILRAILCEPEFLIMDEPVSGLDPLVREKVIEWILEIRREWKLGILFISHDLDVVEKISDRIYVLESGRIIEEGKVGNIPNENSHPYTRELFNPWEETST